MTLRRVAQVGSVADYPGSAELHETA
jgi:hypothetical protein